MNFSQTRRDTATRADTTGFFDQHVLPGGMSPLHKALRDLPDPVFADVLESDREYLLILDLPGAAPETTEVNAELGRLTIEARRDKDLPSGFHYRRENRSLFLDAQIPIPPDAVGRNAEAVMDRGVLEIRLPKREHESGGTIPIERA